MGEEGGKQDPGPPCAAERGSTGSTQQGGKVSRLRAGALCPSSGRGKGGQARERAWRGKDKLRDPGREHQKRAMARPWGLTGCRGERVREGSQAGFRYLGVGLGEQSGRARKQCGVG